MAEAWGKSHCNLLSWYFGLYAQKKIDMSYTEYFKILLEKKCCNEDGKLLLTKNKITPVCFGFDYDVVYLSDFSNVINPSQLYKNSFYQLKIINTMHYMITWIENIKDTPMLLLADTNNRGIGILARLAKRVDKDHFAWLLEI